MKDERQREGGKEGGKNGGEEEERRRRTGSSASRLSYGQWISWDELVESLSVCTVTPGCV